MTHVFRGSCVGAATLLAMLSLSSTAWADDFISECQKGTSAADPLKACTCMSTKVTGSIRADAIEGMRRLNTPVAPGGTPPDPKSLPAAQQKGVEAVIAARGQCP